MTKTREPVIGGRILNVSTGLSRYAMAGTGVYAAAKSALEAVARSLAIELGPRRIAVNTVAPGGIVTDYAGGYLRTNEPLRRAVIAETPLGRLGEPEDIADLIATLLSPDTRWIWWASAPQGRTRGASASGPRPSGELSRTLATCSV